MPKRLLQKRCGSCNPSLLCVPFSSFDESPIETQAHSEMFHKPSAVMSQQQSRHNRSGSNNRSSPKNTAGPPTVGKPPAFLPIGIPIVSKGWNPIWGWDFSTLDSRKVGGGGNWCLE